ncbi:hypothetical protein CJ030_MR1G005818 [Morella rubra]|uniref:Uncharacterized protein n=1 Tax=Morella rubra TaxID=262757 RepID=A0A6A1WQK8_9ROSI|nr:hypothetical protein CJ030_MR1G005818 [Morella rubra]
MLMIQILDWGRSVDPLNLLEGMGILGIHMPEIGEVIVGLILKKAAGAGAPFSQLSWSDGFPSPWTRKWYFRRSGSPVGREEAFGIRWEC